MSPPFILGCLAGAALLFLAASRLPARCQHDHFHKRFDDAEKFAEKFDAPARDEWQKPDDVIKALEIPKDGTVLDIGAGTGYFSVRIAKAFPQATVVAVDVEPSMLQYLQKRAAGEHLHNIITSEAADPKQIETKVPADVIVIVNVYHHLPDRVRYFTDLSKKLKGDGTLAIIDFTLESPEGPPKEHRIGPEKVIAELKQANLQMHKKFDFLPNQYFLVFKPIAN